MKQALLTAKEASTYLCVHPKTLYKWTDEGKIPFLKIDRLLRFSPKDIEEWQNNHLHHILPCPGIPPRLSLPLKKYDKMLLKGRSALSKTSRRWNYGFGAIYVRKTKGGKDRWYIDFRDETGRRAQRVVKHAFRREDALIELQTQVTQCFSREHPGRSKTGKIAFSSFVEVYLENYAKSNKRSWKDDRCRLHKLATFFGNRLLQEITPLEIERFKLAKVEQGTAKSTVNRYLAILKRMYNVAIDWGSAWENPVRRVRFYQEKDNLKQRVLAADEEDRLLASSSASLRPILVVALNTGMRRGEILSLEWDQVDLQAREIRVENTKSGRRRIVDVNSSLLEELTRLKSQARDSRFVFPNPKTGKPFTKLQKSFQKACLKADIRGLRFHDLRHTFASRLVERGVDIVRVKELLGHSTVRITERYTHTNREERKKAVESLCRKPVETPENRANLLHICDMARKGKDFGRLISLFSVN